MTPEIRAASLAHAAYSDAFRGSVRSSASRSSPTSAGQPPRSPRTQQVEHHHPKALDVVRILREDALGGFERRVPVPGGHLRLGLLGGGGREPRMIHRDTLSTSIAADSCPAISNTRTRPISASTGALVVPPRASMTASKCFWRVARDASPRPPPSSPWRWAWTAREIVVGVVVVPVVLARARAREFDPSEEGSRVGVVGFASRTRSTMLLAFHESAPPRGGKRWRTGRARGRTRRAPRPSCGSRRCPQPPRPPRGPSCGSARRQPCTRARSRGR